MNLFLWNKNKDACSKYLSIYLVLQIKSGKETLTCVIIKKPTSFASQWLDLVATISTQACTVQLNASQACYLRKHWLIQLLVVTMIPCQTPIWRISDDKETTGKQINYRNLGDKNSTKRYRFSIYYSAPQCWNLFHNDHCFMRPEYVNSERLSRCGIMYIVLRGANNFSI